MPNSHVSQDRPPHVAVFPSAGMGHLTPCLRLAAMLASRGCSVTVITAEPPVSAAESNHLSTFFSTHPHINRLKFHIIPFKSADSTTADPFFIQFEAINRSVHLLRPLLLSSSPPLSALFSDFAVLMSTNPIADDLSIPNYVVCTTSARFFSLLASLSAISEKSAEFKIPGLSPIPASSIPPPFFDPNHLFTSVALSNSKFLQKANGILLNTFERFEPETIFAINNDRVLNYLPPILPIGPFEPYEKRKGENFPWLDDQSVGSVVYVSFGSRTAMSRDQIRELGNGLERSGFPFFWVLKASKVDKEDKEEIKHLLGESFLDRTKGKGIVVREWVNQEEILRHPAIGGFVSHCGWNSVMEAARHGVPVLAWPQHGDQRVNAEVVESAGLGIWVRSWGWEGERLVRGEEIGDKVRELMNEEMLKDEARSVGEKATKACEVNGSSEMALMGIIDMLKA